MIFKFRCDSCGNVFEENTSANETVKRCTCGGKAVRQFEATRNFHIPSYFHTNRSDIFTNDEWTELKKDPNIERVR